MAEQENGKDDTLRTEKKEGVILRVDWNELGPAVFANQVLALTDEGMLHLGFYQTIPPLVIAETDEERKRVIESLEQRGTVDAKLVVHVALPLSKLTAVIEILAKQTTMRGLTPESR
ncbi:MAG: hypothetical protein NTW96_24100 [Planctomycetia bacterium]|nr:hypothetical protein [Planctomycetia bacterium]